MTSNPGGDPQFRAEVRLYAGRGRLLPVTEAAQHAQFARCEHCGEAASVHRQHHAESIVRIDHERGCPRRRPTTTDRRYTPPETG